MGGVSADAKASDPQEDGFENDPATARKAAVLAKLRRVIRDIVRTFKAEKKNPATGILSMEDAQKTEDEIRMENVVASVMKEMTKPRQKYGEAQTFHIQAWLKKHGKHERQELHELQLAQLRECFELMDTDKGGSIDEEELKECFKLLGIKMSKSEAKALFDEIDEDGSGSIEYDEFVDLMTTVFDTGSHGDDKVSGSFGSFQLASSGVRRSRLLQSMMRHDNDETKEMIQKYNDFKEGEIKMQKKALRRAAEKRERRLQIDKEKGNLDYGEFEQRVEAALPAYMRQASLSKDARRSELSKAVLPVLIRQGYSGYIPDINHSSLAAYTELPGHRPTSLVLSPASTPRGTSSFNSPRDGCLTAGTGSRSIKLRMLRSQDFSNVSPRTLMSSLEGRVSQSAESLSHMSQTRSAPVKQINSRYRARSSGPPPNSECSLAGGISAKTTRNSEKRQRSFHQTEMVQNKTLNKNLITEHLNTGRPAGKGQKAARPNAGFSGYTPRGKYNISGGGFRNHGAATARTADRSVRDDKVKALPITDDQRELGAWPSDRDNLQAIWRVTESSSVQEPIATSKWAKQQQVPGSAPAAPSTLRISDLKMDGLTRHRMMEHPRNLQTIPTNQQRLAADGAARASMEESSIQNGPDNMPRYHSQVLHLGQDRDSTHVLQMRQKPGSRPHIPTLNLAGAGIAV